MNTKSSHLLSWLVVLVVFWWTLSGYTKPLLLTLGVLSVALVLYLVVRMDRADAETRSAYLSFSFLRFWFWLLKAIAQSSLEVARLVWHPRPPLSPRMGTIHTRLRSRLSKATYVNSITLTPGTVAVDIEGDVITVHALRQQTLDELNTGAMERRIPEANE